MQPSEAEIGSVDTEAEAVVMSSVDQLLDRLNILEAKVEELQGRLNQDSCNRPIIVNFGFLFTFNDLFNVDINISVPQADVKLF
ncbi:hypothetical protein GFS31_42310 (plasmid) [Leptolyngbya sp. BL0902]|nr:hypothetical protein GFS31_42310 [Leptolyngbya sp. BL0902]